MSLPFRYGPRSLLIVALLAFTSFGGGGVYEARAETDFGSIASRVTRMLSEEHYLQKDFDDSMSENLLENYLRFLDFSRVYFTQEDVESFKSKYATTLDDAIAEGNLSAAYDIYAVYEDRVKARVEQVREMLAERDFTFDTDGETILSRKDADWPANEAAAKELWTKMIEGDLLEETLRLEALDRLRQEEKEKEQGDSPESDAPKAEEENASSPPQAGAPEPPASKDDADKVAEATESDAEAKADDDEKQDPEERILDRYDRILETIAENDQEDVAVFFIKAIARTFDPHSEYFSQSQYDNFRIGMSKSLTGIGAMLTLEEDGSAGIRGLVVGGPAHKGGELQVMDKVVAVGQGKDSDLVDIIGMKLDKIVDLIRGEAGSIVQLKVIPADAEAGGPRIVSITRDKVDLKESLASADLIETKDAQGNDIRLGWIYLLSFYSDMSGGQTSTTADVQRLVNRLKAEGIDGLVLDLRDNGGGSLEEAINLTGLFIPRGPVVQSKDWRGNIDAKYSRNRYAIYDGPMLVLTNRSSASASEILAAALQDYNRAVVVGEKTTFGKGTVQQLRQVQERPLLLAFRAPRATGGALKLTIQKFFRISGGSTQLEGVKPDILLPSRSDALKIGEAALDNPLSYELIEAQEYEPVRKEALPIDALQAGLDRRMETNPEFRYIFEDVERAKERIEKNVITLNRKKREAESLELEERADRRKEERIDRFAKMREDEKGLFTVYGLTQDNVNHKDLVLRSSISRQETSGMVEAEEEKDAEAKALEFPHGFDPVQRQAIEIMKDFIGIESARDRVTISATEGEREAEKAKASN